MGDSEERFRRPHGTALCGERRKRGPDLACVPSVIHVGASAAQLRAAVQRRQGPGSSDGRFVTLRVCHWMAVGIRRIRGQTSAVKPCVCSAANCLRLRRRDGDALGRFVRSAFGRVFGASWPGAIRWLESDLRSGQRREHRPNFPALVLRRVVASGRFFRRRPLGMVTRDKYSPHIFEPHILSLAPAFSKLPAPPSWRSPCRRLALPRLPVPTDAPCTNVGTMAYYKRL